MLIVEDDPDVGESTAVLLRMYGYPVELARDLDYAPLGPPAELPIGGADEAARRGPAVATLRRVASCDNRLSPKLQQFVQHELSRVLRCTMCRRRGEDGARPDDGPTAR